MITKLFERLIIMSVLFSINLIAYGEVMDLKGEYYEKNGCIYLIGNLTQTEKQVENEYYRKRMAERIRQLEIENQQRHELKIETIKAQAMRDYLIAQGIPLREVADALRNLKIRQSVNIGNVTSSSYLKIGDVDNTSTTTNNNTNISENTNDNKTKIDVNVKK